MFPKVAKLAANKQNVLLPQWQNEETLSRKTYELRMRVIKKLILEEVKGRMFTFSRPQD